MSLFDASKYGDWTFLMGKGGCCDRRSSCGSEVDVHLREYESGVVFGENVGLGLCVVVDDASSLTLRQGSGSSGCVGPITC